MSSCIARLCSGLALALAALGCGVEPQPPALQSAGQADIVEGTVWLEKNSAMQVEQVIEESCTPDTRPVRAFVQRMESGNRVTGFLHAQVRIEWKTPRFDGTCTVHARNAQYGLRVDRVDNVDDLVVFPMPWWVPTGTLSSWSTVATMMKQIPPLPEPRPFN
jgi:hypothetical protein